MTARTGLLAALAVLATSVLCFAGAAISVEEAQAATRVTIQSAAKGPGMNLKAEGHLVHVGPYRIDGHLMYCTDWGLELGNGAIRQGAGPAKVDAPTRTRLDVLVNAYGQVSDDRQGARVKLAVDTLVAPFDARLKRALPGLLAQMTATDRALIAAMVDASRTHAPYRVAVSATPAVPGQVGSAVATVTGSDGRPAAGRAVSWTVAGGSVKSTWKVTDRAGRSSLTYAASSLTQTPAATVTSASSSAVWQNAPSKGHQLMIGGGFTETTRGSAVAELCPVEASHRTVCPCKKQGDREITITWSAAALTGWYRGIVTVDGAPAAHVDLAAGETGTATIRVKPGQDVSVEYSIYASATRTGAPLVSEVLDAWLQR